MDSTIFAPATGRGAAGIAIVRLSGPAAWAAAGALAPGPLPPPRRVALRLFRDGEGSPLDEGLLLLFAAGASYTGEPMAELHLHGSPAVLAAVLGRLGGMPGLRPAEPGEFTRRALAAGRMDLPEIEGLADLLAAETEAQRRQALRVMRGVLSALAGEWRRDLVRARALLEATLDFAEEEVPADIGPEVRALLARVASGIGRELAGAGAAERIRDGFEVAIVGRPNAGKSSLLNALARREAAIVADLPGTTRDLIEVRLDLEGLPVTLVDMAGLRDCADPVESMGVARARRRAGEADLRLILLAPGETLAGLDIVPAPGDIVVLSKADLRRVPDRGARDQRARDAGGGTFPLSATPRAAGRARRFPVAPDPMPASGAAAPEADGLAVSVLTGQGLGALRAALAAALAPRAAGATSVIRTRQRLALETAAAAVARAAAGLDGGLAAELVAEEIGGATRALEALIGKVDVEAILDDIFASFCIGK